MKARTHYSWFNTTKKQEIIDVADEVAAQVVASCVSEGFVLAKRVVIKVMGE